MAYMYVHISGQFSPKLLGTFIALGIHGVVHQLGTPHPCCLPLLHMYKFRNYMYIVCYTMKTVVLIVYSEM